MVWLKISGYFARDPSNFPLLNMEVSFASFWKDQEQDTVLPLTESVTHDYYSGCTR